MPSRLRQAAGQTDATAQDDARYNISGLNFNQALTWRAGKALVVADLLSRLQKLGGELRGIEQGQIAAQDFRHLAQDLAHSNLLGHKDKGVRAWALCCVVDILNICAPDAPFNPVQLRDIFKVVTNVLQNLDDPSNAYNAQHIYILDSLTDTKSIVLITDLEKSEELITPLFTVCFDIVSGATRHANGQELAKSVEFQIRSMLVTIIDEAILPQETVDIILSQYLRVDPRTQQDANSRSKKQDAKDKKQDTLHLKDYPPAYNMAKSICTTCTEKMTAYVSQYVGTIIMNASSTLNEEGPLKARTRKMSEAGDSDEDDDSVADLRKAHRLVRELWRACPDVLINVIGQIEAELFADSVSLRQLATETLGDIIAGVGISGPPPTTALDPSAYPLPSIADGEPNSAMINPLLVPASPKPFGSVYSSAYQAFLGRRLDKSSEVRTAWIIAVGRILRTDAGGIGMSAEERQNLLSGYAGMLRDIDDRVRHEAIERIGEFGYHTIVKVLAADGGLAKPGTLLSTLADRVTDRKSTIREEALTLLARIWGTASGDIQNNVEVVVSALGGAPSRICNAMYTNDLHIHMQLDVCLFENLIPITFPPIKSGKVENPKKAKSHSQSSSDVDADHIRVLRILTLVRSLDLRAKQIFFGIQKRQVDISRVMKAFLKACEDYNGGIVDDGAEEQALKEQLTKYVQALAKQYPDAAKATADLWKFIKMHDRRNYQLIRFTTGPEHDYRTMSKAIKELTKRIKEGSASTQAIMDTLLPLLYRCALIVYSRSHVPAIMEISRSNEGDLGETAHEVLKDISIKDPEVLKSHIQALCKELEQEAPSTSRQDPTSAADTLKACAGFALKYPSEVPKDRKFLSAMTNFALFSRSPRAAKHATTILLTVSDKKELHAKELISKAVKNCNAENPYYLARLATISQLCLFSPAAVGQEEDSVLEITVANCLQKNQASEKASDVNAGEAIPSQEAVAKQLALKAIVNRVRSADDASDQAGFDLLANNVLTILMALIENDGEMTKTKDTPPAQRNRLRLAAAHYLLKLCSHKRHCEELVTPEMFISVALIVINPPNAVRAGFIQQLQKYLTRGKLNQRWHTTFFLVAFEPDTDLKLKTVSWLKSRMAFYERQQKSSSRAGPDKATAQQAVMENLFARLLSLLAHHPDYPNPKSEDFEPELLDFARYIVFYLQAVATDDNISLIFHIAQRVKQTRDAVTQSDEASNRLYVLSDLAQAVIRNYADLMPAHAKGVNLLQTWPGRVALPTSLFAALPSSAVAQQIAAKNYLPEDVALGLEKMVRQMVKGTKTKEKSKSSIPAERKRKSDSVDLDDSETEKKNKKVRKSATLPIRKTPKATKRKSRDAEHEGELTTEQPSRKSARKSAVQTYAESDSDDRDDDDMEDAIVSSPTKSTKKTPTKSVTQLRKDQAEEIAENNESDEELTAAKEASGDDDEEMQDQETESNITSNRIDAIHENEVGDDTMEEADVEADDDDENREDEMEGTPSPQSKPKSTRATRMSRGKAAKTAADDNNTTSPTNTKANGTKPASKPAKKTVAVAAAAKPTQVTQLRRNPSSKTNSSSKPTSTSAPATTDKDDTEQDNDDDDDEEAEVEADEEIDVDDNPVQDTTSSPPSSPPPPTPAQSKQTPPKQPSTRSTRTASVVSKLNALASTSAPASATTTTSAKRGKKDKIVDKGGKKGRSSPTAAAAAAAITVATTVATTAGGASGTRRSTRNTKT